MAVVYNPNNNLREINEPSTAAAAGSLFRQPSNTRKSFSEVSPRRGSGSTTGSTAEFTGVRHSFSSNNGSVGNNGGGSRASFSSAASSNNGSLGNNGGGSRASFLSAASSNNGAAPALIEFPNTEHSNSGSVASYEVPQFRKPVAFSRPLSAVQPFASSSPRRSATAGPVPVQGSAARLPPALPSPSRTKVRLPTLAKPTSTRVINAGGSGSTTPVIKNWMTGKKTPTPFTAFRRNTRYRKNRSSRKSRRNDKRKSQTRKRLV